MRTTTLTAVLVIVGLLAYIGSLGYGNVVISNNAGSMLSPDTAVEFGPLLPNNINPHFMASGNCDGCHGYDPTGHASVDAEGHDISPITAWRATMMANSGKDPFFRAKMSHESTMNPSHQAALEDKCTSCHAPLGRYSYHMAGLGPYGLSDLLNDPFGQDGVSCMGCHKQTSEHLGTNHSGQLYYNDSMVEYGPYEKPYAAPMQDFVGVTIEHGSHVVDAGFCAGCHTLITNSVDLFGNYTGTTFVEQATYHEWLNSNFADPISGITCQGCHIPRTNDPVVIAANHLFLPPRTPFGKHDLVGGNTFMLKLMKTNREVLDIRATAAHFDSTIAKTLANLQQRTLQATVHHDGFANDTAYFRVELRNLVGHKFPSGYPSRRAYVEFVVLDADFDTLFHSGVLDADHSLQGEDTGFEPHYNIIKNEGEVQIYEIVMGNAAGQVTTVLEQAVVPLKDNRLVPQGFSSSHAVYDTTAIVGNALTDDDFNFDGFVGSGTDVVHYHVPLHGTQGELSVRARVYYQAVPKKWVSEMFAISTPSIDAFQEMFENADHTPVLIASDSIIDLPITLSVNDNMRGLDVALFPNPTADRVWLRGWDADRVDRIEIFSLEGKRMHIQTGAFEQGIGLPKEAGVYLIRVSSGARNNTFRVVRHH